MSQQLEQNYASALQWETQHCKVQLHTSLMEESTVECWVVLKFREKTSLSPFVNFISWRQEEYSKVCSSVA